MLNYSVITVDLLSTLQQDGTQLRMLLAIDDGKLVILQKFAN